VPGVSGVTVVTTAGAARFFCPPGYGRIERPAFPAPSFERVRIFSKPRAKNPRRDRGLIFIRHCERSEAIHSFFLLRDGLLRCARNDVVGLFEIELSSPSSRPPSRTHNHRKWGYAKVVE
jgi:hypothetical protein